MGGVNPAHGGTSHGPTTLEIGHRRVGGARIERHCEGEGGIERHLAVDGPDLVGPLLACRAPRGPTRLSYPVVGDDLGRLAPSRHTEHKPQKQADRGGADDDTVALDRRVWRPDRAGWFACRGRGSAAA
jgi:hypothetical protein